MKSKKNIANGIIHGLTTLVFVSLSRTRYNEQYRTTGSSSSRKRGRHNRLNLIHNMVGVDWRTQIEALGKVKGSVTISHLHSDESMTEDDESDIEQSYKWCGWTFLDKRVKKEIVFRKWVKEVNANMKPFNLALRSWPRSKREP